ncbi:MAG: UDP-3-O-[3-hydroxymyristoyl] N-acetylglucosamine deacetylase [Phycisphaeraceae bacterium]|nr:UDP-3-O-[3-hydroxymyristoyl] N-acetylglucosamine deacetylase [Phycisphaeraceae bacterium]
MSAVADSERMVMHRSDRQRTLAREVTVRGRGLLTGHEVELVIAPAPAGTGIIFERTDLKPTISAPASVHHVVPRQRRTTLRIGTETIETVEHCLSALAGLRIDNAFLRLSGPELPLGDGSATPFTEKLLEAGFAEQDAPRRVFHLDAPILVEEGESMIAAFPDDGDGMKVFFDLDYGRDHRIPRQAFSFDPARQDYLREIAPARTFSLREEAEALWNQNMCLHLTPRDVLVIGEDGPIENAYRFDDEPVRHKILDVIGDLSLVGRPVACRVVAHRSGHGLNRRLGLRLRERMHAADLAASLVSGRAMDARAIQRIMPHRYPMLLVDRVLEMDGDRRAVGVKNVTINEPFFQGHYPGTPIMPGVLIVEAMAQLGGLLLSQTLEHTGRVAMLLSLDKVKLRKPIVPGDQVILEAETLRASARSATVHCRASVGGKLAAEAQIRFMMVDSEQA